MPIPPAIRQARPGDEDAILSLLTALADYEKLLDRFHVTKAVIARDYLGERPLIQADLAFEGERAVGIASWYWAYASFAAKRVIFLEDLFVPPEFRGHGYGKALMAHLARTAVKAGADGVEWRVLDWNKPSIDFYESLRAKRSTDWHVSYLKRWKTWRIHEPYFACACDGIERHDRRGRPYPVAHSR
jgi:GNAT superfamily N-acetyltransferase